MKLLWNHHRYLLKRISAAALFFFGLQLVLRLIFLVREFDHVSLSAGELLRMFGVGLVYDMATFSFMLIPYVLYLLFLPRRWHLSGFDVLVTSIGYGLFLYILLFDVVAEWTFWDEFSVRFNFIAVDYLVYTQEVLANIWESYPVIWLLLAIAAIMATVFYWTRSSLHPDEKQEVAGFGVRLAHTGIYLLIPTAFFLFLSPSRAEVSANNYMNEITKSGIYSLFSAFLNNELKYGGLYLDSYPNAELPAIRSLLEEEELGQAFLTQNPDDITRYVPGLGEELHKNVIMVVMESMSGQFMARFGNQERLTPNLDALIPHSLFFNNTFATGTRTVRGLEALSLSIPPSPGRSIIKRPDNGDLASIGFVFQERGYDTRFIYGGYGYFDNMNEFFSHNGFDIVDRAHFEDGEETFANAWGVCDEDLFNKVLHEADASYQRQTPFMHMIMTTSNHRPYTFPAGRDNIPAEGGGRSAGVRYADYAVGKFLKDAAQKPWFKDTVFVFIADHTAGSAGKEELTVEKYHIPLFIYAPGFIEPREVPNLTSQIDVAPILLSLLHFSYNSRFYGEDILHDPDEQAHAFVANYQKLGFIADDSLVVLKPGQKYAQYREGKRVPDGEIDKEDLLETIAYYKHAADWHQHIGRIPTLPGDSIPQSGK